MAVDDAFLDRVMRALLPLGELASRKMFGGAALYRGGRIFGVAFADALFLRVDEASRGGYVRAGMGPFCPQAGRQGRGKYMQVPPDVVSKPAVLRRWAERAVAASAAASTPRHGRG